MPAASARLAGLPPPPPPPPTSPASRRHRRLRPPPRLAAASARQRPPPPPTSWPPTASRCLRASARLPSFPPPPPPLRPYARLPAASVRTHAVRTADENIDRTLRLADVILIQFDRTREGLGVRSAGPSTVPFSFSQEFTPHILLLGGFDVSPGCWSMQL
ncbi:hypothetical protein GUJ93_ZPchr0004g38806 [Zizania palustris]|uniref:Uncharacterized protein n=1 Tax=Zizania palustris TaxID=103762 RepID=A0A8J5SM98_ZIZPA|nr:hypothetical protein GUJ93_ZPchr0004g38806 [Zizania palustris]